MTWGGFQELTADRKAKGFSVVQIVCGRYPDEVGLQPRWENEGGRPYTTTDFTAISLSYFDYEDWRIQHLVNSGIVPAVGGNRRALRAEDCSCPRAELDPALTHRRTRITGRM